MTEFSIRASQPLKILIFCQNSAFQTAGEGKIGNREDKESDGFRPGEIIKPEGGTLAFKPTKTDNVTLISTTDLDGMHWLA